MARRRVNKKRATRTRADKIECVCGCGKRVTRQTELNHLGTQAPAAIRARLVDEDRVFHLGLNTTLVAGRVGLAEEVEEVMEVEEGAEMEVEVHRFTTQHPIQDSAVVDQDEPYPITPVHDHYHDEFLNPVASICDAVTALRLLEETRAREPALVTRPWEDDVGDDIVYELPAPGELNPNGFIEEDPVDLFQGQDNEDSEEDSEDSEDEDEGGVQEEGDEGGIRPSDEMDGDYQVAADEEDLSNQTDAYFRLQFHREATKAMVLDPFDLSAVRRYAFKVEGHLSERLFNQMPQVYPDTPHESLKKTKKHIESLSGFKAVQYSCCVNSCVCFTGSYVELQQCPVCREDRFKQDGRPRKYFEYIPLSPRLKAMIANTDTYTKMLHRSQHKPEAAVIKDIYDGTHYQSLLSKTVPGSNPPTQFFADPRDIALGLSTDGFGPFRRRDKTSWPIILFNYNLSPKIRFQKKYCINIGTVPGPRKPHDWDSFLWPLFVELVELELGVEAYDAVLDVLFVLHVYLIIAFGDIPAVSLMMRMKGQNGVRPCRMCNIRGVSIVRTLYVPLCRSCLYDNPTPVGAVRTSSGAIRRGLSEDRQDNELDPEEEEDSGEEGNDSDEESFDETLDYDPVALPMRTHEQFMQQALQVQMATTRASEERLARKYGIKGIPLMSYLSSMSFPASFPFDFMHLIWENTLKNLMLFWTGKFKDLSHTGKNYVISTNDWATIGAETVACNATIPSSFGASIPDLSKDGVIMTAEMHANWAMFVAPIVLEGRLHVLYYNHFMELRRIIGLCTAVKTDPGTIDEIERGLQQWVLDYEMLYYEKDHNRLSACPLTIHALLHIADGIRACGPVWAYWAYPMERHCNTLLPAIRSRRHPYASIAAFVTATAQLDQIRLNFNASDLVCLDPLKSDKGFFFPLYPDYKLTFPRRHALLPNPLRTKVWAHLATRFQITNIDVIKAAFPLEDKVMHYGRVVKMDYDEDDKSVSAGDVMRGSDFSQRRSEDSRNASFVRYDCEVDLRANQRRQAEQMTTMTFFGELKSVIVIELPASPPPLNLADDTSYVLAVVAQAKVIPSQALSSGIPVYTQLLRDEVVDISTIKGVVGRIKYDNSWAIVDRNENVDFSLP